MVDFYGKLVGKYTVRPMDPMGCMYIAMHVPLKKTSQKQVANPIISGRKMVMEKRPPQKKAKFIAKLDPTPSVSERFLQGEISENILLIPSHVDG